MFGLDTTPVVNPLTLFDLLSRIKFAILWESTCALPLVPRSGPLDDFLVIDNLSYDRELNPPQHESDPPVVTLIDPTNGSTVTGATVGEVSFFVRAAVHESDLASMTATLNGHPAGPVTFVPNGPNSYGVALNATGRSRAWSRATTRSC